MLPCQIPKYDPKFDDLLNSHSLQNLYALLAL